MALAFDLQSSHRYATLDTNQTSGTTFMRRLHQDGRSQLIQTIRKAGLLEVSKTFILKRPHWLLLIAGIWLAGIPFLLKTYVEDYVWTFEGRQSTGLDRFLCKLHDLPHGESVAIAFTFLGCGIALAAACKLVRP